MYDRIKTILLAFEDWSFTMIYQALRIHETMAVRHINGYLQSEKLRSENGGSQCKMSATHTISLIDYLAVNTYFENVHLSH